MPGRSFHLTTPSECAIRFCLVDFLGAISHEESTFVLNCETSPTSIVWASAISLTVRGQLRVHTSATIFLISDREINSTDSHDLQKLRSGVKVISQKWCLKSLFLLSWNFCNVGSEQDFFGLWGSSFGDIAMPLSTPFPRACPS
jgi:hypothetical protein